MRRLFDALGIDYRQWLVLTRIMLKLDLRSAGNFAMTSTKERSSQSRNLWMLGIFYGLTGLFLIGPALIPDPFSAALLVISIITFMIGALLLIEFQSVVISPDDYAILAYRPISSRTFFAIKITNVLIYVVALASLMGTPTIITYAVIGGVGRAVGGIAAILSATVFVTLALISSYALILRIVHPRRLRRALSYLQMFLSILVYGGYALLPRIVPMESLLAVEFDKTPALLLYPPSWFASLVDLGAGRRGAAEVGPALLGMTAIGVLLWYSIDRLSLSYAERLAGLATTPETPSRRVRRAGHDEATTDTRRRVRWLRDETRAVALLLRGQFRYDMKFRMAVIGLLPLTGLYIFLGLERGPLLDPFTDPGLAEMSRLGMLHLALIFLPALLLENMATSEQFRASWVFFATPADKARLIVAARWLVFFGFIVPYLLFVAAILAWFFGDALHAVVHVGVFGLIANLVLDVAVLMRPQLPFARRPDKTRSSGMLMLPIVAAAIVVMGLVPFVLTFAYASVTGTTVLLGALIVANVVLAGVVIRRARELTRRLQYSG